MDKSLTLGMCVLVLYRKEKSSYAVRQSNLSVPSESTNAKIKIHRIIKCGTREILFGGLVILKCIGFKGSFIVLTLHHKYGQNSTKSERSTWRLPKNMAYVLEVSDCKVTKIILTTFIRSCKYHSLPVVCAQAVYAFCQRQSRQTEMGEQCLRPELWTEQVPRRQLGDCKQDV